MKRCSETRRILFVMSRSPSEAGVGHFCVPSFHQLRRNIRFVEVAQGEIGARLVRKGPPAVLGENALVLVVATKAGTTA